MTKEYVVLGKNANEVKIVCAIIDVLKLVFSFDIIVKNHGEFNHIWQFNNGYYDHEFIADVRFLNIDHDKFSTLFRVFDEFFDKEEFYKRYLILNGKERIVEYEDVTKALLCYMWANSNDVYELQLNDLVKAMHNYLYTVPGIKEKI